MSKDCRHMKTCGQFILQQSKPIGAWNFLHMLHCSALWVDIFTRSTFIYGLFAIITDYDLLV